MNIELAGWEARGFRCPDIKVDLCINGSPAPIALIQMPNGTGKTTTLNLLKAALTGQAATWPAAKVRSFQKRDSDSMKGLFVAELRVDGQSLVFEMQLDFEQGSVQYRTSFLASGGILNGWKPPAAARRFLSDHFVNLFVFDGELAERLLDPAHHEAERAIDALFQLYLFDQIKEEAEKAWTNAVRGQTGRTSAALTGRMNKLRELQVQLTKVVQARDVLGKKIAESEKELAEVQDKIRERIDRVQKLREQREDAEARLRSADERVGRLTRELMSQARKPHTLHVHFAEQILALKGSLDTLKLPATTSRQFFLELLHEDHCICGREFDDAARTNIRDRSARFLGADTSGFLNAVKTDIDNFLGNDPHEGATNLIALRDQLIAATDERAEAKGQVRAIADELRQRGDEEIERLQQQEQTLSTSLKQSKDLLYEITRDPDAGDETNSDTMCQKALEKQVEEAKRAVAEISETLTLRQQTEVLTRILDRSRRLAKEQLRRVILEECSERLRTILAFNPVEIAGIDGALRLKNQEGASVGQTLAVGYTFLTTLLGRGHHQFPLVVDSPANPIDNTVRSEIAKIIPSLTKQFVAFTISSERSGFVDQLDRTANGSIRYVTLFRKNEFTQDLIGRLPATGAVQTTDGVLIEGREYFYQFDDSRVEAD